MLPFVTPRVEAFAWDTPIFHALNRDFGPVVDALVRFFHSPRSGLLCGAALLAWAVWKWRARVLKPMLARARPCYALGPGSFRQVVPAANSGSLPSLHAANWFAAVAPLALAAPPAAPVLLGLAAVVSLSRVVGGVHWPSDVLFGALVGMGMGLLATLLVRALFRRWRARTGTLAPPPGAKALQK